ncbi:MAG TPA: hypothetical protein VGD04_10290 [Methylophilus sp.]
MTKEEWMINLSAMFVEKTGVTQELGNSLADSLADDMYPEYTTEEARETAWLVEKDIGGSVHYLYCDRIGLLDWTPSNQKAMRFSRKEDADSIVSIVEDADRVAEHMWVD